MTGRPGRMPRTRRCARGGSPSPHLNKVVVPRDAPDIEADLAEELAGLRLFAEVPQVLEQARAAGLRLAVCSNLAAEYGPAVLGLLPGLDAYVLSYEVGLAKPDPAIFQRVCDALGCAPGEVMFSGDSKRCDVDGPRAFGMQARHLDRRAGQSLLDVLAGVV